MSESKRAAHTKTGFWGHFAPPPKWRFPVAVALGVFAGLGLLLLRASRATSYVSAEPAVCINCHIMVPQFTAYHRDSHRGAATCNDCHLPHNNFARKYAAKGRLGMRHAWVYATRTEPQVIRSTRFSMRIVQENCLRCHADLVETLPMMDVAMKGSWEEGGVRCWQCHRETGHGVMSRLASAPNALAPMEGARVPAWLEKLVSQEHHGGK